MRQFSTVTAASATAPIPRFILGPLSVPNGIIYIPPCQTLLLFPYVTDAGGFDTGLAISNTSQDTWGTTDPDRKLRVELLRSKRADDGYVPALADGSILPGTTAATLASTVVPTLNFSGYVTATCTFQFAHGFAFVSDLGARNLAMGYLALIVTNGAASASRGTLANVPAEILDM